MCQQRDIILNLVYTRGRSLPICQTTQDGKLLKITFGNYNRKFKLCQDFLNFYLNALIRLVAPVSPHHCFSASSSQPLVLAHLSPLLGQNEITLDSYCKNCCKLPGTGRQALLSTWGFCQITSPPVSTVKCCFLFIGSLVLSYIIFLFLKTIFKK